MNIKIGLSFFACIALFVSCPACSWANEWGGGVGSWHDPANWATGGVPDATRLAEIIEGDAQISSPAFARELEVGRSGVDGNLATVTATSDISVSRGMTVGRPIGGSAVSRAVEGVVSIQGGDFALGLDENVNASVSIGSANASNLSNSLFSGTGTVNVIDGSFTTSGGFIRVGSAGGTESVINNQGQGNGTLNVTNGDLEGNTLFVGNASGTGSAIGTAHGLVSVSNGNITLEGNSAFLLVGFSGGTGSFAGDATGILELTGGNLTASIIQVGRTDLVSSATGDSDGRILLTDGDIVMQEMEVGFDPDGPAYGLLEHIRGLISGTSFSLGTAGDLVLGISGTTSGDNYSQLNVNNVLLDGNVEARFVDGFLPQGGDVYDLVVANNLSGNYNFSVTGINQQDYPNMRVVETNQMIRLKFLVPEPTSATFTLLAMCIALKWRNPKI